jgi:hypothetical protein
MAEHSEKIVFGSKGQASARRFTSWKFLLGRWFVLPSLGFWGIRIESLDARHCSVSIPFSWRTKNPFRSTYFSALMGSAELSTGALLQCHLADHGRWSMLVVRAEVDFIKKATSTVRFSCDQGALISQNIQEAEGTQQPMAFVLKSKGYDRSGELCCTARIHWSIKKKG